MNANDKAHDLRCVDGDFTVGRVLVMPCLDGLSCSWTNIEGVRCDDPLFTVEELLVGRFAKEGIQICAYRY